MRVENDSRESWGSWLESALNRAEAAPPRIQTFSVAAQATYFAAMLAAKHSRAHDEFLPLTLMLTETCAPPTPQPTVDPGQVQPSRVHGPSRRLTLLLALLLAAATLALYVPAVTNGFVNFDDPDYVTRNTHVLRGLTWPNVVWAFGTDNPAANWHPLTWISHMLDVQWCGLKPAGHHFTNILLHAVDVALLFFIVALATDRLLRSAAVAALFAIHPLNVESVAWIAERKAVLCVLFFFLSLWAYGWYVRKPSIGRYSCVMALFALGLMSKVMVIALPFALLLLDYWPLRRFPDRENADARRFPRNILDLVIEKIPLFALAAAGGWMTLYVHHKEGALTGSMPLAWRMKNVIYSYAAYLGKLIWPTRLAVFYPHPENSLSWTTVALAALLLVGISTVVWRFRDKHYLLVGWLWFVGTMFPMIGLVQSGRQGMADRYMHIPMFGLLVAVVWLLADAAARLNVNKSLLAAAFLLIATPYMVVARTQIGYWKNSYTLFTHALQVTKNNGIAENDLGSALMDMGQLELATTHFEAATHLIPDLASAHYNLGGALHRQNRLDEAAREYRQSIALFTDPLEAAQAHNNLGILYLAAENDTEATKELSAAVALNPAEQNAYLGRGTIELKSFNIDAAIADFSRAAQIAPSPVACFWLGRALEAKGDFPRATSAYAAALQLAPNFPDARARLDALQAKDRP
jgi:tetratricopeptide (TPR) repeat protein